MADNFDELFDGPSSETIEPDPRDTGNYESPLKIDTLDEKIPEEYSIILRMFKDLFYLDDHGRGNFFRMALCEIDKKELEFYFVFINSLISAPVSDTFEDHDNEYRYNQARFILEQIDSVRDRIVATMRLVKTPAIIVPKEYVGNVLDLLAKSHGVKVIEDYVEEFQSRVESVTENEKSKIQE